MNRCTWNERRENGMQIERINALALAYKLLNRYIFIHYKKNEWFCLVRWTTVNVLMFLKLLETFALLHAWHNVPAEQLLFEEFRKYFSFNYIRKQFFHFLSFKRINKWNHVHSTLLYENSFSQILCFSKLFH